MAATAATVSAGDRIRRSTFLLTGCQGSGFFIADRWALTAAHCLEKVGNPVDAVMPGGERLQFESSPIWIVRQCDMALLLLMGPMPKSVEPVPVGAAEAGIAGLDHFWRSRAVRLGGWPGNTYLAISGRISTDVPVTSWVDETRTMSGLRIHSLHVNYGGISGGPVWDDELECVVAICTHQDRITMSELAPDLGQLLDQAGFLPQELRERFRIITPYTEDLWNRTAHIEVRGLNLNGKSSHRFRIDRLFTDVPLVSTHDAAAGSRQVLALGEILKQRCLVVVGDPGAGKSTLLRRLAFAACETRLRRTPSAWADLVQGLDCLPPILIDAASLVSHIRQRMAANVAGAPSGADWPAWVAHYLGEKYPQLGSTYFDNRMRTGALLLIDGLDEATNPKERRSLVRLVADLAQEYWKTRVVASSRPPEHGGEVEIPDFEAVRIGPLGDEAVVTFLRNWSGCLGLGTDAASLYSEELLERIRRPHIREMASNPMLLSALAVVYWNEKERVFDEPCTLYERVVDSMAKSRDGRITPQEWIERMMLLACEMDGAVKFSQAGCLAALARMFPSSEAEHRAKEFLDNCGLPIADEHVSFWHRLIQDYLTAAALASLDEQQRYAHLFKKNRLYRPEWRETMVLLAGLLHRKDQVDGFFKAVLDAMEKKLWTPLTERAQGVDLIARALEALKRHGYVLRDQRYHKQVRRLLEIFEVESARKNRLGPRLKSAEALGLAGDPRLSMENWIEVPPGSFWMGAQREHIRSRNYDPEAPRHEGPVKQVTVDGFELGRYPVTVKEYREFVDQGGYSNPEFWDNRRYKLFRTPEGWAEQQRHPNRPVVGVSWWEAAAYCRFRSHGCGPLKTVRLPSESEWEYAARSGETNVIFAWSCDAPFARLANFGAVQSHPSPVGLYPEGRTPWGFDDMIGNVWEWTLDVWRNSPGGLMTLRGGSWSHTTWGPRVTIRQGLTADTRLDDVGFRCLRES